MKPKKKLSKIAQAIEDSVFANVQKEIVDDNNEETAAKVVEQDEDFDDIFMRDFSSETKKPSKLRVLNSSRLDQDGSDRYKGKKVSRKDLDRHEDLGDDDDLDEESDEDEEEELNEHAKAELGHMFEMEGVDYDDDEEEKALLARKKRKFRPDPEELEGSLEEDDIEEDDEEDEKEPEYVKNLKQLASAKESDDDSSNEDEASEEEESEESEDEGFKAKVAQLKSSTVEDVEQTDEESLHSVEDEDSEEEDDLGPDLSDMFASKANEEEEENEEDNVATFSKSSVDKEVSKGKSIMKQQQVWDGLLELRISLQKALIKVNQLPQNDDWKTYKAQLDDDVDVKKCQIHLAKVLDQLLQLRTTLLNKNQVLSKSGPDEQPSSKKRKLNDYEQVLESNFESMTSWRNATIVDWNDRTRIASNDKGFSGFDTSVVKQIEHILADKSRLVKRTKLKRTAYDILGQEATNDDDHNDEIFDDDDFYHQLLRELIERKTAGVSDPIALGQQWVKLQKVRAKAKKKVDTKASKGRKTRFDIHAKLVNFMAPTYPVSTLSEEAKTELFASLFKGQQK